MLMNGAAVIRKMIGASSVRVPRWTMNTPVVNSTQEVECKGHDPRDFHLRSISRSAQALTHGGWAARLLLELILRRCVREGPTERLQSATICRTRRLEWM